MKHALVMFATSMAALAAACSTPVPALHLALSGSDAQHCPSTQCELVSLACPAVMSIKIMDPDQPDHPYLTQCTLVSRDGNQDMCSLASVDLGDKPIPVRRVEVQIALYPASDIAIDPDGHSLLCPDDVAFAAGTGFPIEQASPQAPTPALGGVGYYEPGDSVVTVDLGCTDLAAINTSCIPADLVMVNARVEDFSTGDLLASDSPDAAQLDVFVGEPQGIEDHYELPASALHMLPRQTGSDALAAWADELSLKLTNFACVEVLEPVAQATPTVSCTPLGMNPIALRGAWIGRKQLAGFVALMKNGTFPAAGMTVGMVVDSNGRPVKNATVTAKPPPTTSITYLSDDAAPSFVAGSTGSTGIFLSTGSGFGTEFSTSQGAGAPTLIGIGGNIQDVVTVVILSPSGS